MASFATSNQQEAPSTTLQDAAACKNGGIGGLFLQCGYDTDIGGGRENQDDCFIWRQPGAGGTSVLCVLDGHGREVGRIAANAARASLREYFDARFQMLRTNPYECLVEAHEVAHRRIKAAFREELEGEGYEVEEAPEGYLLKRMPPSQAWGCVHGGSSCSIVALVDHMIYIANVGDSSGTLSCSVPVLSSGLLKHLGDAANMTSFAGGSGKEAASSSSSSSSLPSCLSAANAGLANGLADDHGASSSSMVVDTDIAILVPQDNLVITAEHSPESPSEFCRLRTFRPKPGDPMQPALAVVYDSPSADKAKCTPVFVLDDAGVPTAINKGKYYKNVRKEWASLVSTPSTARFQDALAFTRSLGDLHLHTFGTFPTSLKCVASHSIPFLTFSAPFLPHPTVSRCHAFTRGADDRLARGFQ